MHRTFTKIYLGSSYLLTLLGILIGSNPCYSQISLSGQIRPRAEIRDGLGNLAISGADAASFISQRTRLAFGYKWDKVLFGATVQDVRVWGQDASSISASDGNKLMLHEGWAEIILANKADTTIGFKLVDNLSFKIGRQELIYDDARLIGNLDWLQQARRFDMALLKTNHRGWQIDLAYAFNQNTDAFGISGTNYIPANIPQYIKNDIGILVPTPTGMIPLTGANGNSSANGNPSYSNSPGTNAANQNFKNFQSLYISKQKKGTKVSILAFRDAFSPYTIGSVESGGGNVYGRIFNTGPTSDRYTTGALLVQHFGKNSATGVLNAQSAYYIQTGKDRDGRSLQAYHFTTSAIYSRGKISVGPGIDILSGNSSSTRADQSKRFDPLYGTPHKFWGTMDYFYAGTNSPSTGLVNYYLKSKLSTKRYSLTADYHHFMVEHSMLTTAQKDLGDEIDLTGNYLLNKFTTLELGYSVMFAARDGMAAAKNQNPANLQKTGRWAYLTINIKPDFLLASK